MPMIRLVMMICVVLALTSCKEQVTESYLVSHPDVLEQELNKCRFIRKTDVQQAANCEKALEAASKFNTLMNEQQLNPEKFGEQLLQEEISCQKAKAAFKQSEANFNALKAHEASGEDLKVAQEKLQTLKLAYHKQKETVKVMLAIIGLRSPE